MQCVIYVSETGHKNDEEQFAVFDYENEYEKRDLLKATLEEIAEEYGDAEKVFIRIN